MRQFVTEKDSKVAVGLNRKFLKGVSIDSPFMNFPTSQVSFVVKFMQNVAFKMIGKPAFVHVLRKVSGQIDYGYFFSDQLRMFVMFKPRF